MRSKLAIFISTTAVLSALIVTVGLNPLSSSSVTIRVGGFETNRYRDDSLAVLVTISNGSPATIAFDTTYQTRTASGWPRPSSITNYYSSAGDDLTPLQPLSARALHLPVPRKMEGPWRVVVRCSGTYSRLTKFEELRLRTYLFVFRREPERFLTSSEQPANPALQATAAAPSI